MQLVICFMFRKSICILTAVLPLVDVFGVFMPKNHSRTSKNDIACVTGLLHILEDARKQKT